MSNTFLQAKFCDVRTGEWKEITPDEYNAEEHEGLIQCPAEECSGALRYISEYSRDALNDTVSHHFKTDNTGEPHERGCRHEPGIDSNRVSKMQDALTNGYPILMNVNFPTGLKKDQDGLPKFIARKVMPQLGGEYRPDWIKEHKSDSGKQQYATFSVRDIEQVQARLKEYAIASKEILGAIDHERRHIVVSQLHGVLPWASFYSRHIKGGSINVSQNNLTSQEIFEGLYRDLADGTTAGRLWRPAPVAKMQLEPLPPNLQHKWDEVKTDVYKHKEATTINDQDFWVQDVIIVSDRSLRQEILNASKVSIVSTPFIDPVETQNSIEQGSDKNRNGRFVHLKWPVVNDDQIIFG